MKATFAFVSVITGSFAFAGGMAAGTNQDLLLFYGFIVGAIALFFGISRLLHFHQARKEEGQRDLAPGNGHVQDQEV